MISTKKVIYKITQAIGSIKTSITELTDSTVKKSDISQNLWEGSWNSGTITVPNTDKYKMFLIIMSGQGTVIPVFKHGTFIRGMGGYSSHTPTINSYHFAATFSGDTWTFLACNNVEHKPSSNHGALSNNTVTSIIGLI